jgi:hypothetical protein
MLRIATSVSFRRLLTVSLLFLLILTASGHGQSKYTYTRVVLGPYGGHFSVNNDCVILSPELTSGNFFDGLQWLKTKSGQEEFHKNGQRVVSFPGSIDVTLAIYMHPCNENFPGGPSADKLSKLCNSLAIEASWKRGADSWPAEVLKPFKMTKGPFTQAELLSAIGVNKGSLAQHRQYPGYGAAMSASLASQGIPLTDHLVISIFSQEHKFLTRAVIALTPPPFHVPPKP